MQAEDIMVKDVPTVGPEATMPEVAQAMLAGKTSHVLITDEDGRLLGLMSGYDLRRAVAEGRLDSTAGELMTPRDKLYTAEPDTPLAAVAETLTRLKLTQMPVVQEEKPVGYLNLDTILNYTSGELSKFRQASLILETMREGLLVVDREFRIQEVNPAALQFYDLKAEEILGRDYRLFFGYNQPIGEVLEKGEALINVEVEDEKGRVFLTNTVPVSYDSALIGIIQTFTDISQRKAIQRQLLKTTEELDKAFALTLPNSRVEYKLKNTPEYRDIFLPDEGLIEITEIINDGGYVHVVNALKVTADLNDKGIMALPGIDKDILVQALIFHDVGKSQPLLKIGQIVDPDKVFEDSKKHAECSAEIVRHSYGRPDDVVTLIRYHHHKQDELPDDFPRYLFPMWRLVKIIDGLSAAITRRQAKIGVSVNGTRLIIVESNAHPTYNRTMEIDLYTGRKFVYTEEQTESV